MALNVAGQSAWNIVNTWIGTVFYGAETVVNTGGMWFNMLWETKSALLHVLNKPWHLFSKARWKSTGDEYKAILTQYKKKMSKDTATYVAPYKGDRPEASFWTKLAAGAVHAPIGAVWNTGKTILDTTWRSVATLPVRTTNIFRKKENRISLWKDRTKNMKKRWGKEGYIGGFKQLRATPSTPAPAPTENIKKSV